MTTLLFNNFALKPQPFTTLLNLIINHPLFEQKVIQFRQLFPEIDLKPQHLVKLGTLYYAFILPQFPSSQHKRLATQLYQSLQIRAQQSSSSFQEQRITLTHLTQFIGKICLNSIQNIDLRSSVGFLNMLMDRITNIYAADVLTNQKRVIHYHIKLEVFDSEAVINDTEMPEQFHRLMAKDVYFEQKVNYDEEQMQIKENQVLIRQLKASSNEIVPYGYVCQDFLFELINSDFETKNSYRLKKNRKVNVDKIQYWISANETVSNYVRDQVVNQEIFYTTGVLSAVHLPSNPIQTSKVSYSLSRINHAYSHQNYYQKLKDMKEDKVKSFNILSQFFQRDQFNIDQITLTRQKLNARIKEHLLGIQSKELIKKQIEKDFQNEARTLPQKIYQKLMMFFDDKRLELNIKELGQALKPKLQEGKNINAVISHYLSEYQTLPKDSDNPFMEDVINYAKKQPMQLLIIGRPKSGKSTLARAIAKKYNIVYISVESMINNVFERVKFFEQNPPQADQDGNIIGGLSAIQKCIIQDLNNGKCIEQQDILDLINNELQKPLTQSKGFILDLPFEYRKFWIDCVVSNKIILPKMNCRYFTHVVQIQQTDQQWKYFAQSIMQKPQDLTISSRYDRYLLAKPKPVPQQGQQQAAEQNDEEKPQPLKQDNLLYVKWKEGLFSLIQHITQHIHSRRYLKIQNSYQSVEESLQLLQESLYVIPLPRKIEGAQKELLTVGHDETKLVRKWSPWAMVDPVELKNNRLINGKFQFACDYAGRVFLFQNQNNLNSFLNFPRTYLQKLPQLPVKTNICITGPRKSGKKTLAKRLSQIYQLQIINFQQILERIILKQKLLQVHVPSNPQKRSNTVHLSESQFKQFSKGNLLNAKDILPIILYQLGVALQKKPLGWGVEAQQGGQNQQQQEKKAAPAKKKKKDKNQDDERPKTPPVEDLSLKQIIPEINHLGKLNQIRGYILLNFPNNQQQLNSLKQFNIPIDKLIILNDNNEEAPNKTLGQRLSDAQLQQVALFFTAIQPVKQALGEEVCKDISIDKSPEQILNRVRQLIDPFYLKVDDDAINRVLADKAQQGDPVPYGFCGEYCPVALKDKWLIKGKQEFQAGVQGKRFRFCGQKQFNQFKQNPKLYLSKQNVVVPPRILFMGLRGVGLKTQLLKFNQKYKIPILNLKQTLLQQIQAQKNKRKTERYYKRGFKKPEFDEEGKIIEDQELNAESPDFDKRTNQIEVVKRIFDGIDQIFINGNFFQIDEQKISTNIVQLLTEARKLPEVVYVLKSEESKWLQRNLDVKQIQRQVQEQKAKNKAQRQLKLQEARKAALEAGEQFNPPADEQEQIKVQDRIAAKTQTLKAQREADSSALEGFVQAFRALNIQVVQVNCERQVRHVADRINYSLKPYLDDRSNRWQKYNMLSIQRHRVRDFINHFVCKESRFGKLNPITLTKNVYSSPLIYNERIYYLKDDEQRQLAIKNPSILSQNRAVPQDVRSPTGLFVIGRTKTGKTTLSQAIAQKLGLIYISFTQIVSSFIQEHQDVQVLHINNELKQGKAMNDDQIVKLILKRISLFDCQQNGWILDGLPQNKIQAELLNKKSVIPEAVISLNLSNIQIKKRVIKSKSSSYEFDMQVVHQRLDRNRKNQAEVELYYQTKYNNLKVLDGNLSKWGLFQISRKLIETKAKAKRQFARSLALFEAAQVSNLNLNFNCILNNMSQYLNYCPISYKLKRQYIRKCLRTHQNLALYNRKLYIFNSPKELSDFLQNPQTFVVRGPSFQPPLQVQLEDFKHISDKAQNKGYCMVQLLRKRLLKGNFTYCLIYKNKLFETSTPKNMKLFIKNPTLYEMVKLPDKLPVQFEKKNDLKKIAKRNDCTAFLQHHLSNIMMRSLAQLGYRRPKYATLSSKQSALKFLAISLKATNPNKDDQYRQKYTEQLHKFIKQSSLSEQIRLEVARKKKSSSLWQQADQQNLIKLCEQYHEFMKQLQSEDKIKYFSKFIR